MRAAQKTPAPSIWGTGRSVQAGGTGSACTTAIKVIIARPAVEIIIAAAAIKAIIAVTAGKAVGVVIASQIIIMGRAGDILDAAVTIAVRIAAAPRAILKIDPHAARRVGIGYGVRPVRLADMVFGSGGAGDDGFVTGGVGGCVDIGWRGHGWSLPC